MTVAIANGVTFAADQAIRLSAAGTAAEADYALDPTSLTLGAGETEVSASLTAVDDEAEEEDETVTVSAAHNGSTVGTATVTIAADNAVASDDTSLSDLTLSGIDIGAFDPETTDYAASVAAEISSTTVSASARGAGASVSITDAQGSTAGGTREVALAAGANTITITVMAADGQATRTYTVAVTRAQLPLTASFLDVPQTHDGSTEFTFELRFSEELELSYLTLRDEGAFAVTGGTGAAGEADRAGGKPALVDGAPAGDADGRGGDAAGRSAVRRDGGDLRIGRAAAGAQPVSEGSGPGLRNAGGLDRGGRGDGAGGAPAAFTLTRTGAAQNALTVTVSVTESGAMAAAIHRARRRSRRAGARRRWQCRRRTTRWSRRTAR